MHSSVPLRLSLPVLALLGTVSVVALLFFALHGQAIAQKGAVPQTPHDHPVHIVIPAIHVNANIESVGLTREGAVDAPAIPAEAAWFNAGPLPGEKGNAIIDGHFGWKNGIPAVFDNLHSIKPGDVITVEEANHTKHTFVVRTLHIYNEHEDASAVFNAADSRAHLVLITCGGIWNKGTKSYSDRLVVFADIQ